MKVYEFLQNLMKFHVYFHRFLLSCIQIQNFSVAFLVTFKFCKLEQHALKNVNNCMNTNIYSYSETSGGQSSNPYLNVVHFFNTRAD